MKIHLFFLSVLIFIFFYPNGLNAQCHDKQQRTIEELTKIAKKYGVADRVSINTGLMFCDLDFVEKHFQGLSKSINTNKQAMEFFKLQVNVKTKREYYNLLEKFPYVKAGLISASGLSAEAFEKQVDYECNLQFRVYRNTNGTLTWIDSRKKVGAEETNFGQRIDNLPRQ